MTRSFLSSNERHWDKLVDEAKAAESWLRKHRRRVREGLANKLATKNDPGGRPPFGFRRNDQKLVEPDPALLDRVGEVVRLCAEGMTDREISVRTGDPAVHGSRHPDQPALCRASPKRCEGELALARGARAVGAGAGGPCTHGDQHGETSVTSSAIRALDAALRRLRPTTPWRTGYYRHREPCAPYLAAKPDLGPRAGRADGKGYRREWYKAVVGELLDMVSLGAQTLASVVAQATSLPAASPGCGS